MSKFFRSAASSGSSSSDDSDEVGNNTVFPISHSAWAYRGEEPENRHAEATSRVQRYLLLLQETEEISSQSLEVSRNNSHDASGISLGALAIDRPLNGQATQSQDMLMHTLLERDARHQVMEQRRKAGKSLNGKFKIMRNYQ